MRNTLLQTENRSIERHTKLRMLNLVLALILLFAFVAIRIYRIQNHHSEIINSLVIHSENAVGQYARVSFNEQQFWLEETGVLPIHVNDKEILRETALKDGDIVKIGSALMWFQTVPSMMNRRIIYRQPRRDTLEVTFGNDAKKCDIVMTAPIDPMKTMGNLKSRFMTLTFKSDRYIIRSHAGIPIKLPFRRASIEKNGGRFEALASDNPSQELLILGSTKIVFSYQKGQKIVELAVLEPKKEPEPIWQAQFTLVENGRQISLSKEHPLTITGDTRHQSSGLVAYVREMFVQNPLKIYAAVIFVGFISCPLARKKRALKYLMFWFIIFWIVLGSALIFGYSQSNEVVEEDFLDEVKTAVDRGILSLDDKNCIQLRGRNSELLYAITRKGRDIRQFIAAHNDFVKSGGRLGKDWFLVDEANRKILGLKREAVTIKNFRHLQKRVLRRGRFIDRDGKSVPKLRVIESNSKGLKAGSEIWLNLPQQGKKWRKDIIFLNKGDKTLFNVGRLKIAWRDGKLMLDNSGGDQDFRWYTKIKVSSKGRIYNYPVVRKIRPKMVFFVDYSEGRGVIGEEEIAINQNENRIKLNNLIIIDPKKCFEINTNNHFPDEGKFPKHLAITKRGKSYYARNLSADGQQIFIGGRALASKEERKLRPYDFVRIGNSLLEYIPAGDGLLAGNREDGQRYYPVNLSQTVGYFSYPDLKSDLEETFDKILSEGEDVVLTIDDDLQRIVIDELKLGLQKAGLQSGAVVLLDVETGDILALASEPSYDQNDRGEIFDAFRTDKIDPRNSPILNRALHRLYPPGSFFKIVVASAALQNSDKMPEVRDFIQKPFSHGPITQRILLSPRTPGKRHAYAIHPLKDHGNKTHDKIDIYSAFAESCNIYFASLAVQLGYGSLNRAYYPPKNPLYTFAEKAYLFNDNIDLFPMKSDMPARTKISNLLNRRAFDVLNPFPSEMPSNRLHPSDLSRVGIGQFDVRITPLEASLILSIIANDGIRYMPRLVKRIGEVKFLPDKGERVMSPETARELKTMMKRVVVDGTASYEFRYSKLNDYVAGKTGTPTALDMASKYHVIFGCMAPIDKQADKKPQIALVVVAEYGDLASIVAVPIARQILERVAIYYDWR
ncbi:MAG: penicillin-binding transpeptidase domain-containing protein [Candidatus Poribacteria bacterium]